MTSKIRKPVVPKLFELTTGNPMCRDTSEGFSRPIAKIELITTFQNSTEINMHPNNIFYDLIHLRGTTNLRNLDSNSLISDSIDNINT